MSGRTPSGGSSNERFLSRRRKRRRRTLVALCVFLLVIFGALVWGLHQSALRISNVEIFGAEQSLSELVFKQLEGKYFGIIPRNSIFFLPSANIRSEVLATHADIAAISIFRSAPSSLSLKVDYRAPIARWCGLAPSGGGVEEYCYVFDASGFISAAADTGGQTINNFRLYAPLEGETQEPLRATLAHAPKLPAVFDLARELTSFGSPVSHIVIHDDEVDMYLASGTRITHVLGNEQNAFTALVSARANLTLADGSLEYVDLRFGSKIYLKKKAAGSKQQEAISDTVSE